MKKKKLISSPPPSEESKDPKEGVIPPFAVTLTPSGLLSVPPYQLGNNAVHAQEILGQTGTMIGGTINVLDALSDTMQQLDNSAFARLQPSVDKRITQTLEPIRAELDSTQKQVKEAKSSLSKLMNFIETNKNSLIDSIATQGKMTGLESQMSSVLIRLEKLESDKNISWNKYATIAAIIVSLISFFCVVIVGIAEIYSAFFKR